MSEFTYAPEFTRSTIGAEGVTRLHALVAEQMPDEWVDLDPRKTSTSFCSPRTESL